MKKILFSLIVMALFITPVYAIGGDNDTSIEGRPEAESRVDIDPIMEEDFVPINEDVVPISAENEDDNDFNKWLLIGGIIVILVGGAAIIFSKKSKK